MCTGDATTTSWPSVTRLVTTSAYRRRIAGHVKKRIRIPVTGASFCSRSSDWWKMRGMRTRPRLSVPVAAARAIPYPLTKRFFDRGVGALLILLLSPVFLLMFFVLAVDMVFVPSDRGRWLYR